MKVYFFKNGMNLLNAIIPAGILILSCIPLNAQSYLPLNTETTDVSGYVTDEDTSAPIENVDLEGILQSDTTNKFNTSTGATGFWEFLDIPTTLHNNNAVAQEQDILEVRYDYGAIRFRVHSNTPPQDGKLYNTAGQVLYQLNFEQTDNDVYEATWHKDDNLPRQLLIFSDGTHAAKIAPFVQPTGQALGQRINLEQAKKSTTADLEYLLRFRHPDYQPLDTIAEFSKGGQNYLDVAMQAWPEYVLIVNSKDGNGIDLPDTDWQLVDPNNPQEVLFGGNTGSNALDTLAYTPKTVEDLERVLKTSKAEHEDWQEDVTLLAGEEVIMVSSNVLKEYLYEANIKARNNGQALDSVDVTVTDPNNSNNVLAQVSSLNDTTAIAQFYAPGHEKEVDVHVNRKGYEAQTNNATLHEGENNNLVYDLLANRFFGTISG